MEVLFPEGSMDARELALRKTIPLVINSFNQYQYLRNQIEIFTSHHFGNIFILDNGSTYPPLLEYYQKLMAEKIATVMFYGENRGPYYFFLFDQHRYLFEGAPFLYTDPDLHWAHLASNFVSRMFDVSKRYGVFKVGCALRLPDQNEQKEGPMSFRYHDKEYSVLEWESRFWMKAVEPEVYAAPIDTTMHLFNTELYRPGEALITGLRIAGPGFEALHLPWYNSDPCPLEEHAFYLAHAMGNHWG